MNTRGKQAFLCLRKYRWLLAIFVLIFLPLNWAPKVFAEATDTKHLTLGMVAYTNPQEQYKALLPVVDYLASESGMLISIKLFDSYYSILNDIDHDGLDLAILSPIVYCLCAESPDLTYLGTTLVKGKDFYHAVLIASKDGKINSVKDLAGKKVGFVDRYSASGYLYPANFLKTSGLMENGKALYTPVFLGSHEKAVRALMTGQVDAAATFEAMFDYSKDGFGTGKPVKLEDFRVLKLFAERIPEDPFVCRTALGKPILESLKKALTAFTKKAEEPKSPLKEAWYSGFNLENQKAYDEMKGYLKTIMESR
ncbi:MAG: phosphate/phosphite/phosphonate ABC transporter substrate-binding protein [Candidatus Riflebacteria bacterium]|nr:phosphate/phosphite/phosphonate ABC transporter substrate-binding protein [Candidatus Riflebacteria bacterium]